MFTPQEENDVMIKSQLISETPGFLAPCEGFIFFMVLRKTRIQRSKKEKHSFDRSMPIVY
jgi:hypothetical protein